jgi:heptosyltransferase-3
MGANPLGLAFGSPPSRNAPAAREVKAAEAKILTNPVHSALQKSPRKILAIQFKSLGDAIMLQPSLEAIRDRYPEAELHLLVFESARPLLQHHPRLAKVWSLPRVRGWARLQKSWPVLRALRAERFDCSVDFSVNDRGAITSLLCGARNRLGFSTRRGFFGRRFCFTTGIKPAPQDRHETLRLFHVLSGWDIPTPTTCELSLFTDPALDAMASGLLPEKAIVCHTGAGMSKKEWPIAHWAAFHGMAKTAGYNLIFSHGVGRREENNLGRLKAAVPEAKILPALKLAEFVAVLKQANAVVSNDTGPMHFAAALRVPTVALFGPTPLAKWAPLGEKVRILQAAGCTCHRTIHDCERVNHCMTGITPETVFRSLTEVLSF